MLYNSKMASTGLGELSVGHIEIDGTDSIRGSLVRTLGRSWEEVLDRSYVTICRSQNMTSDFAARDIFTSANSYYGTYWAVYLHLYSACRKNFFSLFCLFFIPPMSQIFIGTESHAPLKQTKVGLEITNSRNRQELHQRPSCPNTSTRPIPQSRHALSCLVLVET